MLRTKRRAQKGAPRKTSRTPPPEFAHCRADQPGGLRLLKQSKERLVVSALLLQSVVGLRAAAKPRRWYGPRRRWRSRLPDWTPRPGRRRKCGRSAVAHKNVPKARA